ncbi:aldolase/citrate lyase family protein [Wenxinia saemankumensis]|uniref:Hydroxypyruvate/pyruvate aldolase n=1 Tax=Wenxinia saemankumensis TaxID=1447782 RepID=A0A1M6FVP3_9RHOB|nr:HpcH/HpaI aldolase/citrate lyase family protein [Wenxinia saemankumensis]SHJ01763.1 2,4-dihydroxyhept-2-enedioate aldolase [Wenxinia saemankumensis]
MRAPPNPLRRKLEAGRPLHGCWLGLADFYAARIAATAGFDWLLIDGEHAPNDLRSILAQLTALEASASAPVVRVPDHSPSRIKQMLDIGAQSLLVPMVETGEEAAALGRACRYPPRGIRGVGYSLARASDFGARGGYMDNADDEVFLMVQVESRRGIGNLDAICAAEGVDGVFVGPFDLGIDMGHRDGPAAPEVRRAALDAIARIAASGKVAGVLALDPGFAGECRAAGARFVGIGIDVAILADGMRALASSVRDD